IWLWDHTNKRHWGLRLGLSLLVVCVVSLAGYGPIIDQYHREQNVERQKKEAEAGPVPLPPGTPAPKKAPARRETPVQPTGPITQGEPQPPKHTPESPFAFTELPDQINILIGGNGIAGGQDVAWIKREKKWEPFHFGGF